MHTHHGTCLSSYTCGVKKLYDVAASVKDSGAGDMDGKRSNMDDTSSSDVINSKQVEIARPNCNNQDVCKVQDGNHTTHLCRPRHPKQTQRPATASKIGRPSRRRTRPTIEPRSISWVREVKITYLGPEQQPRWSEMRSTRVEATNFINQEHLTASRNILFQLNQKS